MAAGRLPRLAAALLCVLSAATAAAAAAAGGDSTFAVLVSQSGLDHVADFLTTVGLGVLEQSDVALDLHTGDDKRAEFGTLALFDVANVVGVGGLRLLLADGTLLVVPTDFTLESEVNVTAEMWPLPVTEETISLRLKFKQAAFGLGVTSPQNVTSKEPVAFELVECSFSDASVHSASKNYWLFDTSMKVSSYVVERNMDGILCPQLKTLISSINSMLNGTVALRNMVSNEERLLEGLRDAVAHYYMSDVRIADGVMAMKVNVDWYRNGTDGAMSPVSRDPDAPSPFEGSFKSEPSGDDVQSALRVDVTQADRQHVTVWLSESAVNDALALLNWDAKLLNASIPVTSEILPNNSRRFFSTMCNVCYFDLFVWSKGAPRLVASATNSTIQLMLSLDVKMWVVNPHQGTSTVFMAFLLGMHIHVGPYIEANALKMSVDLANVSIQMSDEASAFPPEWSYFIEDLVQSMIRDVIWMQAKEQVKLLAEDEGIALSEMCGIDPATAQIEVDDGRFGLSADLHLDTFDVHACQTHLAESLPKLNATAL